MIRDMSRIRGTMGRRLGGLQAYVSDRVSDSMFTRGNKMLHVLAVLILAAWGFDLHANSLNAIYEEIVAVQTAKGFDQLGVLSVAGSAPAPRKLLIIVSGHPGVTRPQKNISGRITTRQEGNFLVRSRQYLISPQVATLLLDCRSDFNDVCADEYQASEERARDIDLLVNKVKKRLPMIQQTWVVSTSRGVITTAGLLKHAESAYAGIIHTAGTYSKAREQGLDFGPYKTPQFIFHHKEDPCRMTLHKDAVEIVEKWAVSLVSVSGGSGFRGQACQAFTQHGFTGREEQVANAIRRLVELGKLERNEID